MFCPSCGLQDSQSNQYCRSCGTDLRSVNTVLEAPNKLAASSTSARDEIGRALAAKIQNTSSSSELTEFTKKILPDVEKFLETHQERKMRRIRNGSMISFVGLGTMIGFFLATIFGADKEIIMMSAFGLVAFFVGLALIVNGMYFTIPKGEQEVLSVSNDDSERFPGRDSTTNNLLMPPTAQQEFSSVTEHTTRHLKEKEPIAKK